MCQDATITSQNIQMNEQSKMLCNVIVRATHDLYADALKSQDEIEQYLKSDCQQLATDDLKQKVIADIEVNFIVSYRVDFSVLILLNIMQTKSTKT